MDPSDYPGLTDHLREQLPRALHARLKVWVLPGPFGEGPTAQYADGNKELSFPVQENGLISETDLARLCVEF